MQKLYKTLYIKSYAEKGLSYELNLSQKSKIYFQQTPCQYYQKLSKHSQIEENVFIVDI